MAGVVEMNIKRAELLDLDIVKKITVTTISEIYPHYYPKGAVKFFLEHHNDDNIINDIKQNRVFLYLDDNQNPVGTVTIKNYEICRLFVLSEYQGKGYGKDILDYAENSILEKHPEVLLAASLPAKGIYQKRGYQEIEFNIIKANDNDFLCYDVMVKKR